jgi:hypothetical protein
VKLTVAEARIHDIVSYACGCDTVCSPLARTSPQNFSKLLIRAKPAIRKQFPSMKEALLGAGAADATEDRMSPLH